MSSPSMLLVTRAPGASLLPMTMSLLPRRIGAIRAVSESSRVERSMSMYASTRAAPASLLGHMDEAPPVELARESHADEPGPVGAAVVDDGDARRERNLRAHVGVQGAQAPFQDPLLVVHGECDIQDGGGRCDAVVH